MNAPPTDPSSYVAGAARALKQLAEATGMTCTLGEVERRLSQTWPDAGEAPISQARWLARAAKDQELRVERFEGGLEEALARLDLGQPVAAYLSSASSGKQWVVLLERQGKRLSFMRLVAGASDVDVKLGRAAFEREFGLQDGARADWVSADMATPCSAARSNTPDEPMPPFKRLLALVRPDRADILAVALFAIAIGVLQLATPIAVQALVNFVAMGGAIPPVLVVAGMLALGLACAGALSATQAWIVEILQRRIFVRMVADLAARLPRVRMDAKHYGPELVNRFFDIVSIQKLGATLLLDGLALVLSVAVGLLLLAFYHPLLLAFDVLLLVVIALLVFLPLRRGIRSAQEESRVKYKTVAWLEEIARNPHAFKAGGTERWVFEVSDQLAAEYVARRREHFRVVFGQTLGALSLQVLASTALLAIGGILVIKGDLTLGQLVAAEIIVSLVVGSVTKTGKHLESFYDLMAATDKVGQLLDLPLESHAGEHHPSSREAPGAALSLSKVAWQQEGVSALFEGVSLELPAGGKLCITGASGSGKSTLVQLLWGLRRASRGAVRLDGRDLRELAYDSLRRTIGLASHFEIVHASVRDNVRLGRPFVSDDDVRSALDKVGLLEELSDLPLGADTELSTAGHPLSEGQVRRLLIARAIAGKPRLLIVEDMLDQLAGEKRQRLARTLFDPSESWTLIVVSNLPEIAERCDLVLTMPAGRVDRPPVTPDPKVA